MKSPLTDPPLAKYSTKGTRGTSNHPNDLENMAGNSVGSPGTSRVLLSPRTISTPGRKNFPNLGM